MRTPGKYDYPDNRRAKKSHNKSHNEYTSISKRLPLVKKDNIPGPGAYLDDDAAQPAYFANIQPLPRK